jgi:hypothetical protein
LGILDLDANERGKRNTLPRNGFENWGVAIFAQLDFSRPIIANFGTALVGNVWKTRPSAIGRGPKINAIWVHGALEVP